MYNRDFFAFAQCSTQNKREAAFSFVVQMCGTFFNLARAPYIISATICLCQIAKMYDILGANYFIHTGLGYKRFLKTVLKNFHSIFLQQLRYKASDIN